MPLSLPLCRREETGPVEKGLAQHHDGFIELILDSIPNLSGVALEHSKNLCEKDGCYACHV